jgi:hypothetical protein
MRALALVVLVFALSACGTLPAEPAVPYATPLMPTFVPVSEPPYWVVKEMFSALNAGDLAGAMSLFAEDAVYIVPRGPALGLYVGKSEIEPLLEAEVQDHVTSEMSDIVTTKDVVAMLHVRIQNAEPLTSEILAVSVVGGQITGVGVDPADLIRFSFTAVDHKQLDRALRLFTSQPACSLMSDTPLVGRQALETALQNYLSQGDIFEVTDVQAHDYDAVSWTLEQYDARGALLVTVRRYSDIDGGKIADCRPDGVVTQSPQGNSGA